MIKVDFPKKVKFVLYCIIIILLFIVIFLYKTNFAYALQIIPEDDFENRTLELCFDIYNSSITNKTLDCVMFFIDLRKQNTTVTIEYNYTMIDNDYIERRIAERMAEHHFLTIDEVKNFVDEQIIIYDNKKEKEVEDSNTQAERDHEYRMEQLKLGAEDTSENLYTEEEMGQKISDAIAKVNPPQTTVPNTKKEKETDYFMIFGIALVGVIGVSLFLKKYSSFFKKLPPPPQAPPKKSNFDGLQTFN